MYYKERSLEQYIWGYSVASGRRLFCTPWSGNELNDLSAREGHGLDGTSDRFACDTWWLGGEKKNQKLRTLLCTVLHTSQHGKKYYGWFGKNTSGRPLTDSVSILFLIVPCESHNHVRLNLLQSEIQNRTRGRSLFSSPHISLYSIGNHYTVQITS